MKEFAFSEQAEFQLLTMNLPAYPCRKYTSGRVVLSKTTKSHKDRHSKSVSGQEILSKMILLIA